MMSRPRLLIVLSALFPAFTASAQSEARSDAEATEPRQVTIGDRGSEQDPLAGREPTILVDPNRSTPQVVEGLDALPTVSIKLDPRVLGMAPGEPIPRLRREGETLRKRDGRLLPPGDRGYAVFIADADPQAGDEDPIAMVLAPCMTLESMERLREDRGENLRFTITGVVHTYRGVNYLMPTSQPKPWLVADRAEVVQETSEPNEDARPGDAAADSESADADPADSTEATDTQDKPNVPKTADEVLQDLLNQRDDTPAGETSEVDTANTSASPTTTSADNEGPGLLADPLLIGLDTDQPQAELKPEGQFIIARNGRLVRSANGSQALFVLDSDGREAPEPPMILHACKLLEVMEDTVLEQGDTVPFVVTGQVFVYRGANYLLPTIVRLEFDRGNLE